MNFASIRDVIPLFAICSIGSAVEFCWASGEAVLVPYLTKHQVPTWVVSTIYLSNPVIISEYAHMMCISCFSYIFAFMTRRFAMNTIWFTLLHLVYQQLQILGLYVQPRLGAWSDKYNQRVPLVISLSIIAIVGIITLLSARTLGRILHTQLHNTEREEEDYNDDKLSTTSIIMSFVGFGLADICFDCLLIPGRALLDDLTVPHGRSNEGNALFTAFQLGGRLIALLIGSSTLTTSGLFGLFINDAHFNACFVLSAAYLLTSMLSVVLFVDDRGATYDMIPTNNSDYNNESDRDDKDENQMQMTQTKMYTSSDSFSSTQEERPNPSHSLVVDASVLVCLVQALGWTGICSMSFFWTAWRGEQVGCLDLALQGVVGMITAGILPRVNSHFGISTVWFSSELFFHLLMTLSCTTWIDPRLLCGLTGINYAVHATNGLLVAAGIASDPIKNRAHIIAMVNNALPMGQLLTAMFGGMIAQYFGGFEYVFLCFGIIGAKVTIGVWLYSSKHGLIDVNDKTHDNKFHKDHKDISD